MSSQHGSSDIEEARRRRVHRAIADRFEDLTDEAAHLLAVMGGLADEIPLAQKARLAMAVYRLIQECEEICKEADHTSA
jgi:RecB family exonuclease